MSKPKVLLLLHTLGLTGAPKVALDALEALDDEVELRTVSLAGGEMEARCRSMGPLRLLSDLPEGWAPWIRLLRRQQKSRWSAELRSWKPDVIYVNSVASLRLAHYINLPSAPVLLHVHELKCIIDEVGAITPDYSHLLTRWPDKYLAVSQPVVDVLVDDFGIDPTSVALVHEFVRDQDFQASLGDLPEETSKPFVVGGAGYPSWRKGAILWIQMAVELARIMGRDKVRFIWVGLPDNHDGKVCREIASKLGVDDLVDFVPITKDPFKHFLKFDVFAMTSWEDPCPIVVLESMMLKKPVACFANSGGAPEEVADSGVIVGNFSPLSMATAIAELANSPDVKSRKGEIARKRVEEHFLASVQAPKIMKEIQLLVRRNEIK